MDASSTWRGREMAAISKILCIKMTPSPVLRVPLTCCNNKLAWWTLSIKIMIMWTRLTHVRSCCWYRIKRKGEGGKLLLYVLSFTAAHRCNGSCFCHISNINIWWCDTAPSIVMVISKKEKGEMAVALSKHQVILFCRVLSLLGACAVGVFLRRRDSDSKRPLIWDTEEE